MNIYDMDRYEVNYQLINNFFPTFFFIENTGKNNKWYIETYISGE